MNIFALLFCCSLINLDITTDTNNVVSLNIDTRTGSSYRILSATSVVTPIQSWQLVSNVLGNGDTVNLPINSSKRAMYYITEEIPNPLYGMNLFVNSNSAAAQWATANAASDPTNSALMTKIATNATAFWLTGHEDTFYEVTNRMLQAAAAGTLPLFTIYNIPHRDCSGTFSSGGVADAQAYSNYIGIITTALSVTNYPSAVVLEPDALANLDCAAFTADQKNERLNLIAMATTTLTAAGAKVYVDAGHSAWQPADTMVSRLKQVGITNAQGFSLNVSQFQTDTNLIAYGIAIAKKLGDIHFVIDTSRNGNGPYVNSKDPLAWCNPPDRALGRPPTTDSSNPYVDAFLWIKLPYESDGACRPNDPPAGLFYPEYALGLASRAAW